MSLRRALSCLVILALRVAAAETPGTSSAAVTNAPPAPPQPTVIDSGTAEMASTEKETTFTFEKNVVVTATNMKLLCDRLVVIARRTGDPSATLGKQEKFKSMVATGNVHIIQNDREATCGRAEVFPDEDKVVLTENPRVQIKGDDHVATAPRMELLRGERRAIMLGDETARPRITLPPLKDLGYDKEMPKDKKDPNDGAKKDDAQNPRAPSAPAPISVPGLSPPK